MKKSIVIVTVVALVAVVSVGAYAYGGRNNVQRGRGMGMSGQRGGMMYNQQGGMMRQQGGMMYNQQVQGMGGRWNASPATCPYGNYANQNMARPGWNAQGQQQGTVPELITEEKAKEVAEEYLKTYLAGYTVENIEKDARRPLYIVSLKGENDAEMQMTIHGFGAQVMHVFAKPAEAATN